MMLHLEEQVADLGLKLLTLTDAVASRKDPTESVSESAKIQYSNLVAIVKAYDPANVFRDTLCKVCSKCLEKLVLDGIPPTESEIAKAEAKLKTEVERDSPAFVQSCRDIVKARKCKRTPELIELCMNQDSYAADYQPEELLLLGKVIKYAGLFGIGILITGTNRTTLDPV